MKFTASFFFSVLLGLGQIIAQPLMEKRSTSSIRDSLATSSLLANLPADNIGPTIFNGRVADIEVNNADPTEFFVAYASGGLWYTNNNGTSFEPLFQHESVITIGDIAVDWSTGTIYIGSGEQNSSRSSYAGNGVYKSTDKGKTWIHIGLEDTHHISKIIIHPDNVDIVWVAALGHLYTKNEERGIFKTLDGGKSWKKTLFVNDETGASDLVVQVGNLDILYAATWQRIRNAWNFTESGEGSGIFKSSDGGMTWMSVSGPGSGFVQGKMKGRTGLALCMKNGKEYLYAIIDNNTRRPKETDKADFRKLTKERLKEMTMDSFSLLKEEEIDSYLEENDFPSKYKAKEVIEMVKSGKIAINDIATYNENANNALFDTPVTGAEVYVSTDSGTSWAKTHNGFLDDVYYSYGYYFGQIRVQPGNPEKVYIFGVPILKSSDGGKTWKSIGADNVHSDHHALWLNPFRPGHLINGNDGGVNISYDDGEHWIKCTHPAVGQFYYVNVDNDKPYKVYAGAQDNGVWVGNHTYKQSPRWQSTGEYPYKSILGGDGMQVQIDNRNNDVLYTGYQFGNYFRINGHHKTNITPKHDLGKKPYRWNWQTPILLSSHNQDILYMGGNMLLRSMNQGKDFTEISGDLTKGGKEGNVPFGTITTIDESKLKFGVIYAGTDDGLIQLTKDGGVSWSKISDDLPQGLWVSRVQASAFDEATVYVSLNGYRNDHFAPYVFMSSDFGNSWKNISSNLPAEPVNVIKEDPYDPEILYVGTDHGACISLDKGNSYMVLASDIPNVPVHDLVVQKESKHLILATHGRSIFKIDISNIYALKKRLAEKVIIFSINDMDYNAKWGKTENVFTEKKIPKVSFNAFSAGEEDFMFTMKTEDGKVLKKQYLKLKKGLSNYEADIRIDKASETEILKLFGKSEWVKNKGGLHAADDGYYYPVPGKYEVILSNGSSISKTELIIKEKKK